MNQNELKIPIQPVEHSLLCSPYDELTAQWLRDTGY